MTSPRRIGRPGLRTHLGPARLAGALPSLAAFAAAALVSLVLVAAASGDPAGALRSFFVSPLATPFFLGNMLDTAALLAVAAAGMTVSIRGGTFNLGGEGQIYVGGLAAAVILLAFQNRPGTVEVPALPILALLAAALGSAGAGAVLAGLAGFLKRRFGADELIGSFLISSAAFPVLDYLITGPLRDPGSNLLATPALVGALRFPRLLPPSALNASAVAAALLVVATAMALDRTRTGFRLTLAGSAPNFARYAGVAPERIWVPAMAASGAFHGLVGLLAVAGTYGACHKGFSGGLGWNAIAVALMARSRPLAILPAALAFAYLVQGSDSALLRSDLPTEATALVQATVFLLVTARFGVGFGPALKQRLDRFARRGYGR